MELDVADKVFVGNDAGYLKSLHLLPDINADIGTCVSDVQEGVLNDHLIWDVFEVDPHVLEVLHWVVEVVVYDVCRQVAGPFVVV